MSELYYRPPAGEEHPRPLQREEAAGVASPMILIAPSETDNRGTPRNITVSGYIIAVSGAESVGLETFPPAAAPGAFALSPVFTFAAAGDVEVYDQELKVPHTWGVRAVRPGGGAWAATVRVKLTALDVGGADQAIVAQTT